MTHLGLPLATDCDAIRRSRRGVTLLSGFLGSGKTTLLRNELDRAGDESIAVIVNDFCETIFDDVLKNVNGEHSVVLSGGCVCCTRRDDLARALAGLLDAEQRGNTQIIDATVPLANMFGYSTILRSLTQGRATYTMEPHSYAQVPAAIQMEIIAAQK